MPNKKPGTEIDEINSDSDIFEQEKENSEDLIDNDAEEKLRDWLTSVNMDGAEIKCSVYKYDNPDGGSDRSQIGVYRNDIPDSHTIGLKYGSGKYIMIIVVPKSAKNKVRKITSRTFKLHKSYDTLMLEEVKKTLPDMPQYPPYSAQQNNNNDALKIVMSMTREIMGIFTPLIAALQQRGNGGNNTQGTDMLSQYAMFQNLLKVNARENIDFYSSLQNKIISQDTPLEGEEKPSIVEQLIPLLNNFIPLLLKKDKTAEKTLQEVKLLPQYKDIINDKGTVQKLIKYLDGKYGSGKVNTILKSLQITR